MSDDNTRMPSPYDNVKDVLFKFFGEAELAACVKNFDDAISHNLEQYVGQFFSLGELVCMLRGVHCGFYKSIKEENMYFISTKRMEQFFGRSKCFISKDLRECRYRRMEGQPLPKEFVKFLNTAGINERQWTVWYRKHL